MTKRVLVVTGSMRRGNSDVLARAFAEGASDAGNDVEIVRLASLELGFCRGCDYCKTHDGTCVLKDDMAALLDKVQAANVIALATPVYYYNVSATMKTFIDRTYARVGSITDKDFYLIATSFDEGSASTDGAFEGLRGMIRCFANCTEKGTVRGLGMGPRGAAENSASVEEARRLGAGV